MATALTRPTSRERFFENPVIPDNILTRLTPELLLEVSSYLDPFHELQLISTSKWFYNTLILDLYRQSGKKISWYPLYIGALENNLDTLNRCLEAGAPLDHYFSLNANESHGWLPQGLQPLYLAVRQLNIEAVAWFLDHGVQPNCLSWVMERNYRSSRCCLARNRARRMSERATKLQRLDALYSQVINADVSPNDG